MKYAHYEKTTKALKGWYDKDIHLVIPSPSIEVSQTAWQEAIQNGFNCIDITTKTLFLNDFRTDAKKAEDEKTAHNAPILKKLEDIDKRSVRPIRAGDQAIIQALEDEAVLLRAKLI